MRRIRNNLYFLKRQQKPGSRKRGSLTFPGNNGYFFHDKKSQNNIPYVQPNTGYEPVSQPDYFSRNHGQHSWPGPEAYKSSQQPFFTHNKKPMREKRPPVNNKINFEVQADEDISEEIIDPRIEIDEAIQKAQESEAQPVPEFRRTVIHPWEVNSFEPDNNHDPELPEEPLVQEEPLPDNDIGGIEPDMMAEDMSPDDNSLENIVEMEQQEMELMPDPFMMPGFGP